MSELKALEKLRGLRDEAASKMVDNPRWVCARAEAIADEIEAEIAERYMELPVGADGVPIHVGDKMEYIATAPFMVCAVAPGVIHAWAETKLGEGKTTVDYPPVQCHHFKPRTIEDVLRDVWEEALDYAKSDMWRNPDEVFAERADELRELMGGGE